MDDRVRGIGLGVAFLTAVVSAWAWLFVRTVAENTAALEAASAAQVEAIEAAACPCVP